jgi:Methyltransferase domain
MRPGERAALEGILAAVQPSVSIEVGTHSGGSLESISAHSEHVHAFDLIRHPDLRAGRFPNVTFHVGDSHETLPKVLRQLGASGTNVDFVLLDGDHASEGVRRDVLDLLESPCLGRTVILLHDTLDRRVRAGIERIDFGNFGKVTYVDLDFVQGAVPKEGRFADHLGAGLGLVVIGWRVEQPWPPVYPASLVYRAFTESETARAAQIGERDILDVEREFLAEKRLVAEMRRTWSWRLTKPLRVASEASRRLKRPR